MYLLDEYLPSETRCVSVSSPVISTVAMFTAIHVEMFEADRV